MFTLFFTVALGIFFSVFATQNTGLVSLNFVGYTIPNIPIYLAILVPVLITLLVGWFIQFIKSISSRMAGSSQKNEQPRGRADGVSEEHGLRITA